MSFEPKLDREDGVDPIWQQVWQQGKPDLSTPSYLLAGLQRCSVLQNKAAEHAVTAKKQQEHMKSLGRSIQRINQTIEDSNGFDLSKDSELHKLLQQAQEHQLIDIKNDKTTYTARERDLLLTDLNAALALLKDKNQMEFHQIQVYSKHHDQFLMLLTSIMKQIRRQCMIPAEKLSK